MNYSRRNFLKAAGSGFALTAIGEGSQKILAGLKANGHSPPRGVGVAAPSKAEAQTGWSDRGSLQA